MRAIPAEISWYPGLSIYASESFLRTVGDEYGWIGGVDDFGELRCILPYTVVQKAILRTAEGLMNPRFFLCCSERAKEILNRYCDVTGTITRSA